MTDIQSLRKCCRIANDLDLERVFGASFVVRLRA